MRKLPKYKIQVVVTKDGKTIEKKEVKSRTWVYNFIRMLYGLFYSLMLADEVIDVTDTAGITRNIPGVADATSSAGCVRAPAGNPNYGIAVGSGASPAYDPSKYSLDSPIDPAQMEPGECTVQISAENVITISRSFTNKSGGDITVTEVALICDWTGFPIMLAYDVISGGVTVPDGATLTLKYTISLS